VSFSRLGPLALAGWLAFTSGCSSGGGGSAGTENPPSGTGGRPATGGAGGAPRGSGGSPAGSGGTTAGSGGQGGTMQPGGNGGAGPSGSGGTADDAGPPDAGSDLAMPPPGPNEPLPGCMRTVDVATSEALGTAIGGAMPGDCIVLGDGTYTFPMIASKGTATAPIVIRAKNTLKAVVMTGNVTMEGAAHTVVEGLHFRSSGSVAMGNCDTCRVSRFRMERQETGGEQDWITVRGTSKNCRIDHNEFGPQKTVGNMIMLAGMGDQIVQYTRIDHNYFHDVTYGGGNGWELIRAGLSSWTFSKAFTVIERNLFVHADSDPETISVKSSDNIIRYNTMRATNGQFTLRHGNRTQVYGNYILGDGRGSTGLRVYGGGHKIYNNYFGGLATGILIDSGSSNDTSGALTDHKQTYDIDVVFNTIVGGRIQIGSSKPLPPRNITAAYNIGTVSLTGGAQVKQMGNMPEAGLVKMGDLSRLGPSSPAIDAAEAGATAFPYVMDDADGRPRMKHDVGAEEMSTTMAKYGLLTAKDVGPMAP
jgi:hypothetical protein